MKKIILTLFISIVSIAPFAQNVGIGTTSPNAKLHVVGSAVNVIHAVNTGAAGSGIVAESNAVGTYGIRSTSINGIAVYGESTNGVGVKGYGGNVGTVAVFGSALSGTGVKAYSFTGTALEVIGNLSISGGNTNPSNGAVLTSDASGNAVWKNVKIGFNATGYETSTSLPASTSVLVKFTESYDAGNNFSPVSAAVSPNTFKAPIAGFYHFDASIQFYIASSVSNISSASIYLMKNGAINTIEDYGPPENGAFQSHQYMNFSHDIHLNAGDIIGINMYQKNTTDVTGSITRARFSGHLVYGD